METVPRNTQDLKQFTHFQAIFQHFSSCYHLFSLTFTSFILPFTSFRTQFQYQLLQLRKHLEEEATQAYFRSKGIKPCPKCTVPIELIAGCKFVTCSSMECKGGTYLCMQCGKHLPADHAAHPCP